MRKIIGPTIPGHPLHGGIGTIVPDAGDFELIRASITSNLGTSLKRVDLVACPVRSPVLAAKHNIGETLGPACTNFYQV